MKIDQSALEKDEAPILAILQQHQAEVQDLVDRTRPSQESFNPLPIPGSAMTNAQILERARQIRQADVAGYQESPDDTGAAREAGTRLLNLCMEVALGNIWSTEPDVLSAMRDAEAAGCKDPLIRLHLAFLASSAKDEAGFNQRKQAFETMKELEAVIVPPRYAPRLRQALHYDMVKHSGFDLPNFPSMHEAYAKSTGDYLASVEESPEYQAFVWQKIKSQLDARSIWDEQRLYLNLIRQGKTPPWFLHMIGGHLHFCTAKHYRGTGFSNTVTSNSWEQVEKQLQLAAQHYLYAWSLQPKNAEPVAEMVGVALMYDDLGSPQEWFLRTVTLQADHQGAYNYVTNALRPRWGGSVSEMLDLVSASLQPNHDQTELPLHAMGSLFTIQQQELGLTGKVTDDPGFLAALRAYADRQISAAKQKPESQRSTEFSRTRPFILSVVAAALIQANDLPRARAILSQIPHDVSPQAFYRFHQRLEWVVGMALAGNAELDPVLLKIDALVQQGVGANTTSQEITVALEGLTRIRKAHELENPTSVLDLTRDEFNRFTLSEDSATAVKQWIEVFLRHAETTLKRMEQFQTGEWVELTTDPSLLGWEAFSSKIVILPPNEVKLFHSDYNTYCQLLSMARFHPPYQIEVRVLNDYLTSGEEMPENQPPNGIVLGGTDIWAIAGQAISNRTFGVTVGRELLFITSRQPAYQHTQMQIPVTADDAHLRLRVWKDLTYELDAGNCRVISRREENFDPTPELAFGAGMGFSPDFVRGSVTLRGMRIRRLDGTLPAANDSTEKWIAHHRQMLEFDPTDAATMFELAKVLLIESQFEEADQTLQKVSELAPHTRHVGLSYYCAHCAFKLRQFDKAAELYQEQLKRPQQGHADSAEIAEKSRLELALLQVTAPDAKLRDGATALGVIRARNEATKFVKWDLLWMLAAAQAETGDFTSAKQRIAEARALAPEDQQEFLKSVEAEILAGKPFRFPAEKSGSN